MWHESVYQWMSELTCAEVEQSATEYALGILSPTEAGAAAVHLAGCPACRWEIQAIRLVGDQLLDLIPDTESPLGFDRKVLASSRPLAGRTRTRRSLSIVAGAVAALVALVVLTTTLLTGHGGRPHAGELTAALRQAGRTIGSVDIGGRPTWVTMEVQHASVTGTVTCQLVNPDGTTTTVGDFELVGGSGTWSAPNPTGDSKIAGARLIGPDGTILATATFGNEPPNNPFVRLQRNSRW